MTSGKIIHPIPLPQAMKRQLSLLPIIFSRGEIMKKLSTALVFAILLTLIPFGVKVKADSVPLISIQGVTEDVQVTIETRNFPANREFIARMGLIGTKGVDGINVGTVNSGAGGSLKFTFTIPASLKAESAIAIRLESTTTTHFAYSWFSNTTFGSHAGGTPAEDVSTRAEILVASVKKDTLVIIKGIAFPTGESFDVLMGKEGSQGIGGVLVETIDLNGESSFTRSFNIPESLRSEAKLTIRFESNDSDLAVFVTFENKTGTSGGTNEDFNDGGTSDIPTIAILSVKESESVTLKTHNFPPGKEFKVLMGKIGTRGIDGIQVTTFPSEGGGTFTKTFTIPDALKGENKIAIRLQTSDGAYFTFNWFYNNTANNGIVAPGYSGIPSFSITAVDKGNTVTINTHNFPTNIDFKVLMGKMGTKGIGGAVVTQFNSGTGGVFSRTFEIPAALAGEEHIAIRLESLTGGFFAYNWFFNATYP
jgi:hypothetical protein